MEKPRHRRDIFFCDKHHDTSVAAQAPWHKRRNYLFSSLVLSK